jgi:hypothetical protein
VPVGRTHQGLRRKKSRQRVSRHENPSVAFLIFSAGSLRIFHAEKIRNATLSCCFAARRRHTNGHDEEDAPPRARCTPGGHFHADGEGARPSPARESVWPESPQGRTRPSIMSGESGKLEAGSR